jgi:uncharacterized protein YjiS (DUF1127 family)
MERAMRSDGDFDYRKLTPEQWAELKQCIMREAHAARAQSLRALYRPVLGSSRSAGIAWRYLSSTAGKWWAAYDAWLERKRAVRALCALDDRSLKDMGLHRSEIESVVFGRRPPALMPASAPPATMRVPRAIRRGNGPHDPKQPGRCSAAA